MLQELANLPDNELMARARKLKDEEAAGILLERYSHLLAVVSLPSLNIYDNTPDNFFPSLIKRLVKSLQTQTIPKIGEWMHFFIKSQGRTTTRNAFYFPSSASSEITRLEYKVEKADINLLQKKNLAFVMEQAFDQLDADHREVLREFYFEQQTFAEMSVERGLTMEETRKLVKKSKQKLASLIMLNLESAKIEKQEEPKQEEVKAPRYVVVEKNDQDKYTVVEKQEEPVMEIMESQEEEDEEEEMELEYAIAELHEKDIFKQEQHTNIVYAKSGKLGQDIKDLQQGSLF
jgi:hypothetical protein